MGRHHDLAAVLDHADHVDHSRAPGKSTLTGVMQRKAAATAPPAVAQPFGPVEAAETAPPLDLVSDRSFVDTLLAPVQRHGGGAGNDEQVHSIAAGGVAGAGGSLPFLDQIQASFGAHDVRGVQAHTDGAAAQAAAGIGATAYATGNHVAFAGAPDLHTAAHEAAHVVQQRAGVHLKGGVGREGDAYEQHADAVADAVVRGESAEHLLGAADPAAPAGGAIQRKAEAPSLGHTAQNKKDLVEGATEAISLATVDCHHLLEHKNEGASAALGSSIHYIHSLVSEIEVAARAPLRPKVEQLSAALTMVIQAKALARSRIDDALPRVRELVGLSPTYAGAVAKAKDVDEGDHHDDVGNGVLHAIDLAGSSAQSANTLLQKPGSKEPATFHAGFIGAQLYRVISQMERIKHDMPELLDGMMKVGAPKVKAAMVHIRALERRGDGTIGFNDLKKWGFQVRELFGAIDPDDKEIIDERKIDDADRKRGDDGIPDELGKNADDISNMKDKKQAAESMLHLVALEAQGMFTEAAAGVRDLAGAALEQDKPKSPSIWQTFAELAINCVTAGIGGGLAFKLVGEAADGIRKAMVEEIMPTLLSETVNGVKAAMAATGDSSRNARGFFSNQDQVFTNKATSAAQSIIARSSKYLDKDADYVQSLIELRTLLGETSAKRADMARMQKAVSLSEYSKGLASENLGKDNQKLEKSATIGKRFERYHGSSKYTGDTDDVDVAGVMDIKFAGNADSIYPKHIKISGLNDALRGKLTSYDVGDTTMPKVIYGELGSGRLAFGVVDGKVTTVDAEPQALVALQAVVGAKYQGGDLKTEGCELLWQRIKSWGLSKLDD